MLCLFFIDDGIIITDNIILDTYLSFYYQRYFCHTVVSFGMSDTGLTADAYL